MKYAKQLTLAIIVDNDNIWSLPVLEKTISILLKNDFYVKSIVVCKKTLAGLSGYKMHKWYFATFGFWIFLKLSLFTSIIFIKRQIFYLLNKSNVNFVGLSKKFDCHYKECLNPNEKKIINFLKVRKPDIILLMTSHILLKPILKIPSIGMINKHSSVLPSNKGLFPYFWSIKNNTAQGVSFHKVDFKIDHGKILYQKTNLPSKKLKSMISFYLYVFHMYPKWIIKAIKNLLNKKYSKSKKNIKGSYFGLPTKNDYKVFLKHGGKIITFKDILYGLHEL
jgi:folate-dependent phosphoribosylglycinamide formyltransferase PurN